MDHLAWLRTVLWLWRRTVEIIPGCDQVRHVSTASQSYLYKADRHNLHEDDSYGLTAGWMVMRAMRLELSRLVIFRIHGGRRELEK